jgi:predicted metallopeptidase
MQTLIHTRAPLELRWASGTCHSNGLLASRESQVTNALPIQQVRCLRSRTISNERWNPNEPELEAPRTPHSAFDFSGHIRRLCAEIVRRSPQLAHVRTPHVLFGFTQARNGRAHGLQARVTPLRFHGGLLIRRHRGVPYQVQRFVVDGQDILYLMTFCLPRFLNQSFEDKLVTVFHELYHISPRFDGDLRRHAGRYAVHSHSQRLYDQHMAKLARAYLAMDPDPGLHEFLRLNFSQLRDRYGAVIGVTVPRPKLVPLMPYL